MAWQLSSWLVLTRSFQLAALLAAGALNGFLVAWVHLDHSGLGRNMVVMQLMIVILLVYTTLAVLLQHTAGRSKRRAWLTSFIVGDILFTGVDLGLVTVMARAGLPTMCVGLTDGDFDPMDPSAPPAGYTTAGFSDEAPGHKGELDKYCAFERSAYFVAVGLIFTYMITITLSVLRICDGRYTKNTRVNELLNSLERAHEKEQQSPLLHTGPRFMPPPSEGIITRQGSLRSVATASHAGAAPSGSQPIISRRPVPNRTSIGPAISPINESAEARVDEEYDALVADGLRHQPQQQQQQQQQQHHHHSGTEHQGSTNQRQTSVLLEENGRASLSEAGVVADGMQYRPDHRPVDDFQSQQQMLGSYTVPPTAAPLDEESAALVSDGSRPMPNLPPYTPGSSRSMPGLAGLATAQPRTQDMKSDGYFKQ